MARKEILKTYHGLPKAIPDEHTIFYASFDGTTKPEIDHNSYIEAHSYNHSSVGLSVITTPTSYGKLTEGLRDLFTIDFYVDNVTLGFSSPTNILCLKHEDSTDLFRVLVDNQNNLTIQIGSRENPFLSVIASKPNVVTKNMHVRVTFNRGVLQAYTNGVKVINKVLNYSSMFDVLNLVSQHGRYGHLNTYISDLHISNIDRGDVFPNLPSDFIEGKAVVQPLVGQRRIWSDTNTSSKVEVIIPHKDTTTEFMYRDNQLVGFPEITVEKAETWETGSKIKIKGYDGDTIIGLSGAVPVVTTTEGTIVVGTWSGILSAEAIFTLGANSSIQGKDLKVVYYVYTPLGKSQYGDKVPTRLVKVYDYLGKDIDLSNIYFVQSHRSIGRLDNKREPFVTEVEVIVNPTQVTGTKKLKVVKEVSDFFTTDVGNARDITNSPFNHVLQRLQSNDNTLTAEVGYVNLPVDILGINANLGRYITVDGIRVITGNLQESIPTKIIGKTSGILRYLVEDQGELKLLIHVSPPTNGITSNKISGKVFLIPLENKPLVKGGN